MRRAAALVPLAGVCAGAGWLLGKAGVPSSYLFAGLLVGAGRGAAQRRAGSICRPWRSAPLRPSPGSRLGICLLAGALLARTTSLDSPTAALGSVAGGASGIGLGVTGALAARLVRMTAGTLLGPMILAAVVVLAVPGGEFTVSSSPCRGCGCS